MTRGEMHAHFKLLVDKADSAGAPLFLTAEIDKFLNIAQEKFVSKRAFGNNPRRTGVEEDQKRRDDLRNLIKHSSTPVSFATGEGAKPDSYTVALPEDYRHALQEEALLHNGKRVGVKPITYDRYNKVIDDPFNTPTSSSAYRIDFSGNTVLLISKSQITHYYLTYLKQPSEIKEGEDCELANHTHLEIVRMAVVEALENVEQPRYQTSKIELNEIE